ncbi:MAG: hypothetical protein Kow002_16690 [Anaerolineales bacterium]
MLVIISDVHLGDGTTTKSISATAFDLFASRLRESAYFASFRADGCYRPIEEINLVLMGDILDPIHSTRWLSSQVRPWTDKDDLRFHAKVHEITHAILKENQEAARILRAFASGESIRIPAATKRGLPSRSRREAVPVKVNIHYMVGNHDWYYRLPGAAFDRIRREVVAEMGLSQDASPFPHEIEESPALQDLFARYKVYARHGDIFDNFNYNRETGRNHASIADVLSIEVLNRFPLAVESHFGNKLPKQVIDSLRRINNIRPILATPLWISGQLKRHARGKVMEDELKRVWDNLCDEFLALDVVRQADKAFQFDLVDALEMVIKISQRTRFSTINDLVIWLRKKMAEDEYSFAEHALREPAFLNNTARYIVYGHTHHHEIVSLDAKGQAPYPSNQVYINSGTWHTYYDLAVRTPEEQKFLPYQALTYLTFYKDDQRGGRHFDAWSGTYM